MTYLSRIGSGWERAVAGEGRVWEGGWSKAHAGVAAHLGVQTAQGAKKSQGNWWDLRYESYDVDITGRTEHYGQKGEIWSFRTWRQGASGVCDGRARFRCASVFL